MKKLAFVLVAVGSVASCHKDAPPRVLSAAAQDASVDASSGDDSEPGAPDAATPDAPVDASPLDASADEALDARAARDASDTDAAPDATVSEPCTPLAAAGMQGCPAGQKCTWVRLVVGASSVDDLGTLACVPDGTSALGQACTQGEPGEATGYDTCAAGLYCASGRCLDICGFAGETGAECAAGHACTRYASVFSNGDVEAAFGACTPVCDPVTQRLVGSPADTCGPGKGCYLLSSETGTVSVCAGAGPSQNVHNVEVRAAGAVTPVYVNSCAPGYTPRKATQDPNAAMECAGYCRPAPVYDDTPASGTLPAIAGMNDGRMGRPNYEGGDTRAMNWMGLPATCANAAGGEDSLGGQTVLPSNPSTGESCQYYYMSEIYGGTSDYSNSVGVCFQFRQWRFDATPPLDGSTPTPDTAWPSCRDLHRSSPSGLPHVPDGAAYFGCTELIRALSTSQTTPLSTPSVSARPVDVLRSRLAPPW